MPQRKSANSLRNICLDNICANIDSYWLADYIKKYEFNRYVYVLGPFDDIPGQVIEALIIKLKESWCLKKHHLEILLNSLVRNLDLSGWKGDVGNVLLSAGKKCLNIFNLNLNGCLNIQKSALLQIPSSFPHLIILNLQNTNTSNTMLGCIGEHCPNLRELDITNCPVSDIGLTSMCLTMSDLEKRSPRQLRLTKIHVLGTNITTTGVSCLLHYIPALDLLNFSNTFGSIAELHEQRQRLNLTLPDAFKLAALSVEYPFEEFLQTDVLHIAIQMCPLVTKVTIVHVELENGALPLISRFQNLRELLLVGSDSGAFLLEEELKSFLHLKGFQLTFLELGEVPVIDLALIGSLCCNLKAFKLFMVKEIKCSASNHEISVFSNPRPLCQLKTLDLVLEENGDVPLIGWPVLLYSCLELEDLKVSFSQSLTDEILAIVMEYNPLKSLTHVHFDHCVSITGETLGRLLKVDSKLQDLKSYWSTNVTRIDFEWCQRYVQENNLDVKMEWM
ncbi:uncharacterized protein LOC143238159 isoform X1 [Tachypleus tridentatus]|uniref:uncharacterized protein LOC143238159 isoform X1 n=1 Tax=Tachypleus tridentatus TaxID=6853 RepID=UPI003FD60BE7